jgi:hypothetical protein
MPHTYSSSISFALLVCILQKTKYSPILLKQKASEIKIKYINVNCDQNDCICKSKRFKKFEGNLKYAFLDPKDSIKI